MGEDSERAKYRAVLHNVVGRLKIALTATTEPYDVVKAVEGIIKELDQFLKPKVGDEVWVRAKVRSVSRDTLDVSVGKAYHKYQVTVEARDVAEVRVNEQGQDKVDILTDDSDFKYEDRE